MDVNKKSLKLSSEDFKFIRRVLGLKQIEFAKLIGVSVQTIGNIENKNELSRNIACKAYAEMMGVKRIAKEIDLKDEQIYSIDKFIDKLVGYINETSTNTYAELLKK